MSKKVLIIDDDIDFLTAYGTLFRSKGCQVHTAINTTEGRSEIDSFAPDLIVLDVMMERADATAAGREDKDSGDHNFFDSASRPGTVRP
jgi:DNA-binding response OmpR family regulator